MRGFFRLEKTGLGGFLVVFTAGDIAQPHARNVADGITNEIAIALVRDSVGGQDLEVEIGDIATWRAVAERFNEGRILAGDAAHTMPPTDGFGGNAGLADAQNIGWKLAYVLKGLAAPELRSTSSEDRSCC